jgi:hypothetical protein
VVGGDRWFALLLRKNRELGLNECGGMDAGNGKGAVGCSDGCNRTKSRFSKGKRGGCGSGELKG